jgi:hypothetical protein
MKRRNKRALDELVPTVSAREIVRIWQTSATVAAVAKKVGRSKNACRVRAYRYREFGDVPMKYFPAIELVPLD